MMLRLNLHLFSILVYAGLVKVWLPLTLRLHPGLSERLPHLLDILQLPKAVLARGMILRHIEQFDEIKPTKFHGSVWELVEWIETSETGKSLNLNLDFRPH